MNFKKSVKRYFSEKFPHMRISGRQPAYRKLTHRGGKVDSPWPGWLSDPWMWTPAWTGTTTGDSSGAGQVYPGEKGLVPPVLWPCTSVAESACLRCWMLSYTRMVASYNAAGHSESSWLCTEVEVQTPGIISKHTQLSLLPGPAVSVCLPVCGCLVRLFSPTPVRNLPVFRSNTEVSCVGVLLRAVNAPSQPEWGDWRCLQAL